MNYWKLKQGLINQQYMYVDLNVTSDYVADSLFVKRRINVKFGDEMKRPGEKYKIIFCEIKKKDINAFEEAMKELVQKMFLFGHNDYLDYCMKLREELEEVT